MEDNVRKRFSFNSIPQKKFNSIDNKETQECLLKWSMRGRIKAQCFSFDQQFQPYLKDEFVLNFFQDPVVISELKVVSSSGEWVPLGISAKSVTAVPMTCSQLSMAFFDRLYENDIARESGHLSKCLDEFCGDFTISDELRKCLLLEDSDNYDIFSDADRQEFLFVLFKHLCLGGSVCQYEDDIKPYMETTKLIYKDLVSVQKDSGTGDLHVATCVFKVTASDDSGVYYPADSDHEQNFAYMLVDPLKRHVNILYHKFGASKFDAF